MASSSNPPDARMSSDSDSDYEPAEEEEQSEGENLAQAYLERLLAGELDEDDEAEGEDGEDGGNGGTRSAPLNHFPS
jgi:WD repeat-containing protein 23